LPPWFVATAVAPSARVSISGIARNNNPNYD
jgi:hypothetical protein